MATADRDVAVVAADLDLRAFAERLTGGVEAQHHGGFATAARGFKPADGNYNDTYYV